MHRPTAALAASLALAAPAGAAGLPAPIEAFAAEQSAVCAARGGVPRVGPAFATEVDLNADGGLDYVVDLAGVECANAWSAFCGASGCPVSVWVARPEGLVQEWSGLAQGWSIDAAGAELAVVVERAGADCPEGAAAPCGERLAFEPSPAPPPAPTLVQADPAAPPAPPAAPAEALSGPGAPGWTLRAVPGASPVAVSDGPGGIASLAAFCLSDRPWLAATPREPFASETARLDFAFADRTVSGEARREDSAGGALIVELAEGTLAEALGGRDASVRVSLDGADQGELSLQGSTRAIRGALEDCLD